MDSPAGAGGGGQDWIRSRNILEQVSPPVREMWEMLCLGEFEKNIYISPVFVLEAQNDCMYYVTMA